jgi:hypothetical protein
MNLDNLNLVEMSHSEMKETEGGIFALLVGLFMLWGLANLVTGGALAPQ